MYRSTGRLSLYRGGAPLYMVAADLALVWLQGFAAGAIIAALVGAIRAVVRVFRRASGAGPVDR